MYLSKGIFWYITDKRGEKMLFCFKQQCDTCGQTFDGSENYNHKQQWKNAPKFVTHNKPFDWFPRGRVEIRHGEAIVFLNPILNSDELVEIVIMQFGLNSENGIKKIVVKQDNSYHYKYLCDS